MKKEENLAKKVTNLSESAPITSPIVQEKLVSKFNALTINRLANTLSNPQNKGFASEKSLTLNYINQGIGSSLSRLWLR